MESTSGLHIYPLCGIFYFPWHSHQIEGTNGFYRLIRKTQRMGGAVAEWVRASTDGSSPTSVKTFLFGTLAIPFTPLCQCLSDETVKAVGRFYLVSMPGEVKYPTSPHWNV